MSSNIVNQVPYLKTSREFPPEINKVAVILTRSYVEIADAINLRTIGIFPTNRPAITGNNYFVFQNKRQQSLRQTYVFTSVATPIPHQIVLHDVAYIAAMYGQWTNGTNWYGLIAGSSVAIAGQRSFYLDPTNIVFLSGAGAPAFVKGIIVIEWISQV